MNDSDQQVGGQRLTQCPMCAYSLTGLPENHVCPECGFAYDETMWIWRAVRASRRTLLRIALVILAFAILLQLGNIWRNGYSSIGDILVPLFWAFVIVTNAQMLRERPWVVVGNCGLVLSLFSKMKPQYWAWEEIRIVCPTRVLLPKRAWRRWNWKLPLSCFDDKERDGFRVYLEQMVPPEKFMPFDKT